MKLLLILVVLTMLPSAHSTQIQPGGAYFNSQGMWSVLTNSFAQDPIYQLRDSRTIEMSSERLSPKVNTVGGIQLVELRVVLPADFEYEPN